VSEIESEPQPTPENQTAGITEPTGDSAGLIWLQTLGPILLFNVAVWILERWFPGYVALGISTLLTGLFWFPIRGSRLRRLSFGKMFLVILLIAGAVMLLDYLFSQVLKLG
jgi:hypothetical protein